MHCLRPGTINPGRRFYPLTAASVPVSSSKTPPPGPAERSEKGPRQVIHEDQRVPLRLTASRGQLGLELYEAVDVGPVSVTSILITLPGLKFPIDLSGGVPKFRHRRGRLEHLVVRSELFRLAAFAASHAPRIFDQPSRGPELWCLPDGIGVGLVGETQALAFDLLWAPDHGDARWVVANARSSGADLPAVGLAIRLLDTLGSGIFERRGRVLWIRRAGERLGRLLLPAVGARAPSAATIQFTAFQAEEGSVQVSLDSSSVPEPLSIDAARALDLAQSVQGADDDLARGETERARSGYLAALERAPRHPEIVRTIAQIDARIDGRIEAAVGLLVESLAATQAGMIGAELLAKTGDLTGARQAVENALRHEVFAPLAAICWLRLSELEREAPARFAALDRAVSESPGLRAPRWARFVQRVDRGDVDGALSDAEHLEAAARGARARHQICREVGRRFLEAGFLQQAGRVFERALRYVPDDAAATAGLARSLAEAGRTQRALSLLERAVALTERSGEADADALIDLAKLLADPGRDLPQAIARVRQVSAASPRLVEARYLEGLWRARLGDRAGAALAFGRLREAIELSSTNRPAWIPWLLEAADNAGLVEHDPSQAERFLATALRLAPNDPEIGRRYREAAAQVALRKPQ